jgi:hypothetical protein
VAIWLLVLVLLCGCEPSVAQKQQRAQERAVQLFEQLQAIKTREQLLRAQPRIARLYTALAQELVETEQRARDEPGVRPLERGALSQQLKGELQRLYAMEGGRELLEAAQEEALLQLAQLE